MLLASDSFVAAQQVDASSPEWGVTFDTARKDHPTRSAASPIGDGGMIVFVAATGANLQSLKLHHGEELKPSTLAGYDPITGLGFVKPRNLGLSEPLVWLRRTPVSPNLTLRAKRSQAVFKGRVKSIGGKVLPLALLKFDFTPEVPPPGTPMLDAKNQVNAILFQAADDQSAYALPVEAVHRVHRDVEKTGQFQRGWLGISLLAGADQAKVVRVLPGSPAKDSGVQADDVLVAVGDRMIKNYADAVDAFFYLVPDQPVILKFQRGDQMLNIHLKPAVEKP